MKVMIDGEEYIRKKDVANLIYNTPLDERWEEFLEKVEAALGFKLFKWQKTYVVSGYARYSGKTTAECLRLLLAVDGEPLDFMNPPRSPREEFFRKQLKDIQEKLMAADIPTRTVFWCLSDKQRYVAKMDGYRPIWATIDEMHEYGRKDNKKWLI